MIVIVEQAVFTSARSDMLALLALLHLCFDGRHALVTDPVFVPGASPAIDDWLTMLPKPLQEEALFVLEEGPTAAASATARAARVRVTDAAQTVFCGPIPELTLPDALQLLQTPLRLLVENRRNDGAFLRKLALPAARKPIVDALAKRWVEFDNGGGITELTARVRSLAKQPLEHMRLWVMFDSDAREPGKPSQDTNDAMAACQTIQRPWPVPAHRHARRTMENYLPLQALFAWSELARGADKAKRRRGASAFAKLTREQRHHYNMKEGLVRDLPKNRRDALKASNALLVDDADLLPLFCGLSEQSRRDLHLGFGSDVGSLFSVGWGGEGAEEEALRNEIPDQERADLLQSIFDRM
jgi:hypothetical protein